MTHRHYLELIEPSSGNLPDSTREEAALISIAISLKRIADGFTDTNEYGESGAAAIGGNIRRAITGNWRG